MRWRYLNKSFIRAFRNRWSWTIVYSNVVARGQEVSFKADTPTEIRLSSPGTVLKHSQLVAQGDDFDCMVLGRGAR
jgi:hypothetical protein